MIQIGSGRKQLRSRQSDGMSSLKQCQSLGKKERQSTYAPDRHEKENLWQAQSQTAFRVPLTLQRSDADQVWRRDIVSS